MSSGGAVNYLANWPAQGTGAAAAPYIIGSTAYTNAGKYRLWERRLPSRELILVYDNRERPWYEKTEDEGG